jgi:hypothetical protein
MKEFTYSEARQNLAALLDRARVEGAVMIRRRDGQSFVLSAERKMGSPLNVPGIDLDISSEDIVELVRAGRRPPPGE